MEIDTKKYLGYYLDYKNYILAAPYLIASGASFALGDNLDNRGDNLSTVLGIVFAYGAVAFSVATAPFMGYERQISRTEKIRKKWEEYLKNIPRGEKMTSEEIKQLPETLDEIMELGENLHVLIEKAKNTDLLYTNFLVKYASQAGIEPPNI